MKTICHDQCNICGRHTDFIIDDKATLLREACCRECHTSLRVSDLVGILRQQISLYQEKHHQLPRLLNLCSIGRVHELYSHMQGYTCGEYFDGIASGEYKDGILCIDLQDMPLADASFDIIVTEDVLEHVASIDLALREIRRVLKPGGLHIFTVPVHENIVTMSRKHKPAVYHGDPLRPEGVKVITDFGRDLADFADRFGLKTTLCQCHRFHAPEETSFIDDEYESYRQKSQQLLEVFRYNSIVAISRKLPEPDDGGRPLDNLSGTDTQDKGSSLPCIPAPQVFTYSLAGEAHVPHEPIQPSSFCQSQNSRCCARFNLGGIRTEGQRLRFAPLEDDCCEIDIVAVRTDITDYSLEPLNAYCRKGCRYLFFTASPAIDIIGEFSSATFLELEYNLRLLPASEISSLATARFRADQEKLAALTEERDRLRRELQLITSAKGYKVLEKLRHAKKKLPLP